MTFQQWHFLLFRSCVLTFPVWDLILCHLSICILLLASQLLYGYLILVDIGKRRRFSFQGGGSDAGTKNRADSGSLWDYLWINLKTGLFRLIWKQCETGSVQNQCWWVSSDCQWKSLPSFFPPIESSPTKAFPLLPHTLS